MPTTDRARNWAGVASASAGGVVSAAPRNAGTRARSSRNAPTRNWTPATPMNTQRSVVTVGDGGIPGAIIRARTAYATGTTVSAPRMMNQFFRYWLGVGTAMPRTISPDARTRRRPADSALTRVYPAPLGVKGEPAAGL